MVRTPRQVLALCVALSEIQDRSVFRFLFGFIHYDSEGDFGRSAAPHGVADFFIWLMIR
jgi:hypothetical protein